MRGDGDNKRGNFGTKMQVRTYYEGPALLHALEL